MTEKKKKITERARKKTIWDYVSQMSNHYDIQFGNSSTYTQSVLGRVLSVGEGEEHGNVDGAVFVKRIRKAPAVL